METAFPYLGNAEFRIFQTILKDFQKALATHILQAGQPVATMA